MTTLCWQPVGIKGGSLTLQPGGRYAVLASVGTGKDLPTIVNYLAAQGLQSTYSCEPPGKCARNTTAMDAWLQKLPSPRSGERWVYIEGNFTGASPWTVGVTDSFPKTLVVSYAVAALFVASSVGCAPAPTVTTPAAAGTPWLVALGAVAIVGGGLWWWRRRRGRAARARLPGRRTEA